MQGKRWQWAAIAISGMLHVCVGLVLIFWAPPPARLPPDETSVSVVMVKEQAPRPVPPPTQTRAENPKPEQKAELAPPPPPPPPTPQPPLSPATAPAATPKAPQEAPQNATIIAKTLYSSQVLHRPENRQALADLATLSPDARIEQLCDTEAMEQLHRWKHAIQPDRLVAYALQNTQVSSGKITAKGAAFRSRHKWFALEFECSFSAGDNSITAFSFKMGDPIPESRWDELMLER